MHKRLTKPMKPISSPSLCILALATMLSCANLRAGVSTESPFAPRGASAMGVASNTPIELRGMTSDDKGGMRFAIYDPVKKEGAWVSVDEPGQSFVVRSYDAATNRIVVDYQGKPQTLVLAEPKFGAGKTIGAPITLGAPGSQPAMAASGRFTYTPGTAAGVQNRGNRGGNQPQVEGQPAQPQAQAQPSASETQRLEAIREEVRRRREAREAGAAKTQPQPQPQR